MKPRGKFNCCVMNSVSKPTRHYSAFVTKVFEAPKKWKKSSSRVLHYYECYLNTCLTSLTMKVLTNSRPNWSKKRNKTMTTKQRLRKSPPEVSSTYSSKTDSITISHSSCNVPFINYTFYVFVYVLPFCKTNNGYKQQMAQWHLLFDKSQLSVFTGVSINAALTQKNPTNFRHRPGTTTIDWTNVQNLNCEENIHSFCKYNNKNGTTQCQYNISQTMTIVPWNVNMTIDISTLNKNDTE